MINSIVYKSSMKYYLTVFLAVIITAAQAAPGGGCLPFTVHYGRVLFLVGKEGYGPSKGQWADFGGSAEPKDTSVLETAAREGSEETRYVFGDGNLRASIQYLQAHSRLHISHANGGYHMFLVQVPYIQPAIIKHAPKVPHFDKIEYVWVDARDFLGALKHCQQKPFVYHGMQFRNFVFSTLKHNLCQLSTLVKTSSHAHSLYCRSIDNIA